MKLAIDFDGVIHDHKHPVPGRRMGIPIEDAQDAIKTLKNIQGHTIIVHTVWGGDSGRKVIEDWMKFYDIPYDEITNIKPQADYYLDDKAIHFTEWPVVFPQK